MSFRLGNSGFWGFGARGAGGGGPRIVITASSILESAVSGSTVGVLSVVGGTGTYTFTKTADPDSKFALAGTNNANLNTAAALDYETATSHSVTISASNGVDDPIVRVFNIGVLNVNEQPDLGALSVPASVSRGSTINITGATSGSTITGTMPSGWTLNGAARTIAIAADAPTGSQAWELVETLADSPNSPRTSSGSSTVSNEPTITLAAPTFSQDFGTVADGFRLVAGDPNANAGLVATNPGNLGWDALTSAAASNIRFNPIVFGGQVRQRTTNFVGDNADPGTYLLAPAGTSQTGAQYIQGEFTTNGPVGSFPTLAILGSNQTERLELRLSGNPTAATVVAARQVSASVVTGLNTGASGSGNAVRMGASGTSQFKPFSATETFTLLAVNGRAHLRRGPGFSLGTQVGPTFAGVTGTRFGIPTRRDHPDYIRRIRVGTAPLFITLDHNYRLWVPKKRASASDPITAGVGDATFTGTYVGDIPSKMQWALYDLETGAQVKDWALVPTADFTASGGTWSARLRSIPAGLNGRKAYAPGFRPVNASDQTDPAWQIVGCNPFLVTFNVGLIGQSNSQRLGTLTTTGVTRVDGLANYTRGTGAAFGTQFQRPDYYALTTETTATFGFCTHQFGDYLANLLNLPVSFESLAIGGRGANNLGPGGADWADIQAQHALTGGAYDLLYLSHGEADFANSGYNWLTQWRDINIPAYRAPEMHGQPAGTVIPIIYAITGRFNGVDVNYTDALANTLRTRQYQLAAEVSDCYVAHSYTGIEMIDEFHYVTAPNTEGYNEAGRRARLTYGKVFNAEAYDGRGPIATSASRSGAVITVSFDLNGATSLVARDGRDQTLAGNASALTSWQVSADNFGTTLPISSAVISGNTVVITLASDPGVPVRVRNHFGLNPDISSFPAGSYADGTFICMMPLVNSLLTAS